MNKKLYNKGNDYSNSKRWMIFNVITNLIIIGTFVPVLIISIKGKSALRIFISIAALCAGILNLIQEYRKAKRLNDKRTSSI